MHTTTIAAVKPISCTVQETKRITGLGNTTIYELIKQGKLRTTTVGKRRLVFYSSITELLKQGAA